MTHENSPFKPFLFHANLLPFLDNHLISLLILLHESKLLGGLKNDKRILECKITARVLDVSEQLIYRLSKDGSLPSIEIVRALRFDRQSVEIVIVNTKDSYIAFYKQPKYWGLKLKGFLNYLLRMSRRCTKITVFISQRKVLGNSYWEVMCNDKHWKD